MKKLLSTWTLVELAWLVGFTSKTKALVREIPPAMQANPCIFPSKMLSSKQIKYVVVVVFIGTQKA